MTASYTNTDLLQLRTKQWVARIKRKTRNQAYQISVKQPMGSASAFVSDLPNVTDTDNMHSPGNDKKKKGKTRAKTMKTKRYLPNLRELAPDSLGANGAIHRFGYGLRQRRFPNVGDKDTD
jgi:hypothetical protein